MNLFKRFLCIHDWKITGSYTSIKDAFAGGNDRSGDIYEFQQCTRCKAERTRHEMIAKDGTIKGVTYR